MHLATNSHLQQERIIRQRANEKAQQLQRLATKPLEERTKSLQVQTMAKKTTSRPGSQQVAGVDGEHETPKQKTRQSPPSRGTKTIRSMLQNLAAKVIAQRPPPMEGNKDLHQWKATKSTRID
jgi:hypothetical protein